MSVMWEELHGTQTKTQIHNTLTMVIMIITSWRFLLGTLNVTQLLGAWLLHIMKTFLSGPR